MKHFQFRILLIAVILPPVLYILSIQGVENRLQARYRQDIEASYIGDHQALLEGSVRFKEGVARNIDGYLRKQMLLSWGVKADVTVVTKAGTLLYPASYEALGGQGESAFSTQIASENFRLLSENPVVEVEVKVPHNTLFSNAVLGGYIAVVLFGLYLYFQRQTARGRREEETIREEIRRLSEKENEYRAVLERIGRERGELGEEIRRLKEAAEKQKSKSAEAEEEMIAEMVALEEKLKTDEGLQSELESQIKSLKAEIASHEKEKDQKTKQKKKASETARKRFGAIYKGVDIHERALSGFLDLAEEMKIKAEEVISQLNRDSAAVIVKRKVFGKKTRETVFEVIFAYSGRLYFRKIAGNRIEVLAVGNKNSQERDLKFLEQL